jgi:hypothetical protein
MSMKTIYRTFGAALAWAVLAIQYVLMITNGEHASIGAATISYVGYFTILTNFLVAFALTAPMLSTTSRARLFFERPAVRAAIALYISVVAVVYHLLLAHLWDPLGWQKFTDICLHTLLPILYLFDWLVFAKKRPMRYARIPYWVIYPAAYGLFIILKGAITGTYPYPFLNVTELGLTGVMINMFGFTALYAVGAAVFITLGRFLSRETVVGEHA